MSGGSKAESSSGYSQQALRAMNERWTKRAEAYQQSRPDDRSGIRGVQPITTSSDLVDRQLGNLEARSAQAVRVDDRAGIRGVGPVETPVVVSSHSDGFDWAAAGIGASIALLAAAMLVAGALTRRRPGLAA